MKRIAILGAGAIGASTALVCSRSLPDAEIVVLDAGRAAPGDRTFVLSGSTCDRWQRFDFWDSIPNKAHTLQGIKTSFAGSFGGITLCGDDCLTDKIGCSIAEQDFCNIMRKHLAVTKNVSLRIPATISLAKPNGLVQWQEPNGQHSEKFDLVVACGIVEELLTAAGFSFTAKEYRQVAIVSTLNGPTPGSIAHERLLPRGAATAVPKRDGWGHILIIDTASATNLQDMDDASYLDTLRQRGWLQITGDYQMRYRGSFTPRQRLARNAGIGKMVLLGPSACSVNPVGAQELNLGLRDSLALGQQLQQSDSLANFARSFSASRLRERRAIANLTDRAAYLIGLSFPGKLHCLGLAATAANLLPPVRRKLLGQMVYRGD